MGRRCDTLLRPRAVQGVSRRVYELKRKLAMPGVREPGCGQPSLSAMQTFQVIVFPLPTIGVNFSDGQLQLSWPVGTLQEADAVTGPFNDVTDVSPYLPTMTAPQKFYRIRF